MVKTIVYLDQNYASSFAKAEYLDSWKDPRRADFLHTLSVLRHQTHEDKLICPTSDFHRRESERSGRVSDFVWRVVDELAFGVRFRHSYEIGFAQMANAARRHAGCCHHDFPDWGEAFASDPHPSVKGLSPGPRVLVHVPSPDELVAFEKSGTEQVWTAYTDYKAQRVALGLDYEGECAHNRRQLVLESFIPTSIEPADADGVVPLLLAEGDQRLRDLRQEVLALAGGDSAVRSFLESEELLACPQIEIRAALMATDIAKYPKMVPTASLNVDFDVVASFLPYVDILTTDAHMKELIVQSGVLSDYPAKVFSMATDDHARLTETLAAL